MKIITVEPDKCTGCRLCELCHIRKEENDGRYIMSLDPRPGYHSRLRVRVIIPVYGQHVVTRIRLAKKLNRKGS